MKSNATVNFGQSTDKGGRPGYKWELLALLSCAFFFHQGDRAIFGVVLAAIKSDLHLSDSELGFAASVLFFMLAVMNPIAGYFGDIWNRKKIIICSLLFWSAATVCTGFAGGLIALVAFRSVATAGGESFYAPAAYPLLATYHTRTRAFALSVHQAALYIGVMVSGFIGGYIAEKWGWRSAFYVFGSGGIVLGFVLIWRLIDAPPPPLEPNAPAREPFYRAISVLFRSPTALLLTTGFAAIVFVNNAYVVWAPVFLQEKFHLTLTKAGGYAMFYHHAAALCGIIFGGWLSDRVALSRPVFRPQMMGTAMLLGCPIIFLMGRVGTLAGVCLAMAAFGLFRGMYEANTHAALFQVIAPRHRASAVGVMTMLAFLVGSLSPLLMGRFRETSAPGEGLSLGFSVLSGAYLLGGVAVLIAVILTFERDRYKDPAEASQ